MNNRKEEMEVWNKNASLYEEKFMNLRLYDDSYDFFLNKLNNDSAQILDVGCGPGNISRYLLNKKPGLSLMGIDSSAKMIQLASKNNPEADFKVMDCMDVRTINKVFDGILCGFCIPYLSAAETIQFLAGLNTILRNRGLLYLSFVEGSPNQSGPVQGSSGDTLFFNYHEKSEIVKLLNINKIHVVRDFCFNYSLKEGPAEKHLVMLAEKQSD